MTTILIDEKKLKKVPRRVGVHTTIDDELINLPDLIKNSQTLTDEEIEFISDRVNCDLDCPQLKNCKNDEECLIVKKLKGEE